jgi:YidC/Oxa1 family membrane protein insertase
MNKNTVIAIVLSSLVVMGWFMVMNTMYPPQNRQTAQTQDTQAPDTREAQGPQETTGEVLAVEPSAGLDFAAGALEETDLVEERVTIETDILSVTFTNAGGDMVSYKLKEHREDQAAVEMLLSGDNEARAFSIALGSARARPITDLFHVRKISPTELEFYRDFTAGDGRFRLTKRYEFLPGEYLFQLTVTLDGGYTIPSLNFGGAAYTLGFGPQIGPRFAQLNRRDEYRNYTTFTNGKMRNEKVDNKDAFHTLSSRYTWAAIVGKYFAFIAIPDATPYDSAFSTESEAGLPFASRFYMTRPAANSSKTSDTYRFYLGPKLQKNLNIYNNADNAYKLRDLEISRVASTSGFLAPLEAILKWLLQFFHRIIPNYGVAIILLTILVKVVLFPLTRKSTEATMRMQTLSPKIQELQAKYKDNPQKLNTEMANLYKKEGYNPMSGCLPMLIQFPIIFAMYNLFNTHFDLRGAEFISPWISDLSRPEFIFSFAPYRLPPPLGWSEIRLLPFIYLASQLAYGKLTQTPDQKGNSQMKMMLYIMPIVFFFVLYDMPSGLLIYWILSNVLTLVQQLTLNKYLLKRKAQQEPAEARPVIAPRRKRK